jgi:hypothetical protein
MSAGPVVTGQSELTHYTSSNAASDARAYHLVRRFNLGIIRAHSKSMHIRKSMWVSTKIISDAPSEAGGGSLVM